MRTEPSTPFSSGTEYENFIYYFCERCKKGKRNEDGFIGFAGWADQGNTNPLLRAFLRWCDDLAEAKEAA